MSFRRLPGAEPYTRRTYGDPYPYSLHRAPAPPPPRRRQARSKLGLARAIVLLLPTILLLLASLACKVTGCQGTAVCTWIDNTPSSLASGIKHLHALSLSATAIQLLGLLQRAHANMLARLTVLANYARLTAPANHARPTAPANHARPTAPANYARLTALANYARLTVLANYARLTALANHVRLTVLANYARLTALANYARPTALANNARPTALANNARLTAPANYARPTALANNARSLSGTPACPSADCVRIAARSMELITSFRRVWEVVIVVMGVVVVLVTAHYAEKYLTMILREVVDSIFTYSDKWGPGARYLPSSPVRQSPPVTAAAQRPSLLVGGRPRVRLERLAEEASVLLEVFSKGVADGGGGAEALGDDQKTMIIKTLRNVLDIKKELKIVVPGMDEKEDNKCVICYDNVADMVVLPCRHLAMCMTCCDGMGIRESAISTYSTAKCPICRTVVTNRMKIFRS